MGGWEWTAFAVALLFMVIGVLGTLVPVLPGIPLIWLAALGFGFVDGFERVDWPFLGGLLLVTVAAETADHLGRMWGARRFGAGRAGAWGAIVGGLAGLFFLPAGLFLGPFLGALAAELLSGRPLEESMRAGWGSLVGTLGSMAVKFVVAVGMTIAFAVKVL
ncbi:MAG: DUF456 domain-containing protein [Limnochordales bacterium]|nr:DUF456 domain-containing protein [Limnochordales bacterium]